MTRQKMIDDLNREFGWKYNEETNGLAELVLEFLENKGMKPPSRYLSYDERISLQSPETENS